MDDDVLTLMELHEQGTNVTVKVARMKLGCAQTHAVQAVRLFKNEIDTASA